MALAAIKAHKMRAFLTVLGVLIGVTTVIAMVSIITGLNLIDLRTQAVMIVLGDQPFVDSQTINNLVKEFVSGDKGIAVPVYQGKRGHPVIFDIRYKDELLNLKGDIGGREIVARYSEDVFEVAVDCEGVCIDIDTVENYTWKNSKSK